MLRLRPPARQCRHFDVGLCQCSCLGNCAQVSMLPTNIKADGQASSSAQTAVQHSLSAYQRARSHGGGQQVARRRHAAISSCLLMSPSMLSWPLSVSGLRESELGGLVQMQMHDTFLALPVHSQAVLTGRQWGDAGLWECNSACEQLKKKGVQACATWHGCQCRLATCRMLLARLLPAWLGVPDSRCASAASAVCNVGASLCVALRALGPSPNARATSLRPLRTTPAPPLPLHLAGT